MATSEAGKVENLAPVGTFAAITTVLRVRAH